MLIIEFNKSRCSYFFYSFFLSIKICELLFDWHISELRLSNPNFCSPTIKSAQCFGNTAFYLQRFCIKASIKSRATVSFVLTTSHQPLLYQIRTIYLYTKFHFHKLELFATIRQSTCAHFQEISNCERPWSINTWENLQPCVMIKIFRNHQKNIKARQENNYARSVHHKLEQITTVSAGTYFVISNSTRTWNCSPNCRSAWCSAISTLRGMSSNWQVSFCADLSLIKLCK